MSLQYATPLPIDASGQPMQEFAIPKPANTTIVSENATVSSVITLNDNTTVVEIAAVGAPVAIKWISASDTTASVVAAAGTANFDNTIPSSYWRRFVVPIAKVGVTSIVGANKRNGLYNRLAYKSMGIGSVLTTQY